MTTPQSNAPQPNAAPQAPEGRRNFLRAVAGAAALSGFGSAFGQNGAAPLDLSHVPLLNLAATAEALSVTLYYRALSSATFQMDSSTRASLGDVLAAEQQHLDLLGSLGGVSVAQQFLFPSGLLSDAGVFAETALHLENVVVSAYIAAAHQFATLGKPELAATAAQLGASEAQHVTVLSQLTGYGTGEVGLPGVPLKMLSDAPPMLAPFLGRAATGRISLAVPTADAVVALAGQTAATRAFIEAYQPKKRSL